MKKRFWGKVSDFLEFIGDSTFRILILLWVLSLIALAILAFSGCTAQDGATEPCFGLFNTAAETVKHVEPETAADIIDFLGYGLFMLLGIPAVPVCKSISAYLRSKGGNAASAKGCPCPSAEMSDEGVPVPPGSSVCATCEKNNDELERLKDALGTFDNGAVADNGVK